MSAGSRSHSFPWCVVWKSNTVCITSCCIIYMYSASRSFDMRQIIELNNINTCQHNRARVPSCRTQRSSQPWRNPCPKDHHHYQRVGQRHQHRHVWHLLWQRRRHYGRLGGGGVRVNHEPMSDHSQCWNKWIHLSSSLSDFKDCGRLLFTFLTMTTL